MAFAKIHIIILTPQVKAEFIRTIIPQFLLTLHEHQYCVTQYMPLIIILYNSHIMKKIFLAVLCALCLATTPSAYAFDLKDALKGLGNAASSNSDGDDDNSGSSTGGLLGSLIGGLLSKDKLTVSDITGEWKYSSPAVSFKSENLLMKAGGAAAASTVESKLEPYYKTIGIENMVFTINADSTFTMQVGRTPLKGTISLDVPEGSQANFIFNFTVLGKVKIGSMQTYVTKSGNNLSIMFDVTKLVDILQKVASISGSSTVKGVSQLLDNYDGVCAGFKLYRSGDAPVK